MGVVDFGLFATAISGLTDWIKKFVPEKYRQLGLPIIVVALGLVSAYVMKGDDGFALVLLKAAGLAVTSIAGHELPRQITKE